MDYSGAQHSSPPLVCIRRHTLYTLSLDGHGLLCVQRRVKLSSSDRPTPSSDRLHALLVLTRSYTVFAPSLTQPGHAARSHQTPSHLCTNGHPSLPPQPRLYTYWGYFLPVVSLPGTEKVLYKNPAVVLERRLHDWKE